MPCLGWSRGIHRCRSSRQYLLGQSPEPAIRQLLDSPVRKGDRPALAQGQSAVWVLLECGEPTKDQSAAKSIPVTLGLPGHGAEASDSGPTGHRQRTCLGRSGGVETGVLVAAAFTHRPGRTGVRQGAARHRGRPRGRRGAHRLSIFGRAAPSTPSLAKGSTTKPWTRRARF